MSGEPRGGCVLSSSESRLRVKLVWASLFASLLVTSESAMGTVSSKRIQQDAPSVSFELVSIKLASPVATKLTLVMGSREFRHSRISLEGLIQLAYQIPSSRGDVIVGGPSWLKSQKYSVVAKYPAAATFDD